ILFLVDAATGETLQTISYGQDLDYEGVARVDDVIYVLEADGDLHYFNYPEAGTEEVVSQKIETRFSYRNDTEGICFDSLSNTLLITPKEQQLNAVDDNTTRRGIYAFDLQNMDMLEQPSFYVDELEIGQIVYGANREYVFRPSGVAVDPLTQDIFVLSSVGNVLVVIDRDSEIKHVELLETGTFSQPEGITFSPEGDLYISSERSSAGNGIIATLTRMKQSDSNE
ncbi:MAG: SdiA-regulated domain-containing protein, partial [Lewinella sp.]